MLLRKGGQFRKCSLNDDLNVRATKVRPRGDVLNDALNFLNFHDVDGAWYVTENGLGEHQERTIFFIQTAQKVGNLLDGLWFLN